MNVEETKIHARETAHGVVVEYRLGGSELVTLRHETIVQFGKPTTLTTLSWGACGAQNTAYAQRFSQLLAEAIVHAQMLEQGSITIEDIKARFGTED